ncbi:hypothetical protein CTAYLR_010067 [Chrysophaeum taylorii]|uniref:PHD-type domain-containing protein n=1 Tax=Chrysophaeum taylorii TaxID=2483200 RepID=A0AAD7UB70_9STRA|nr:hypothetical protein CTAYLR_010067 [Chrysophaeum taylorii]
MDLDRLRERGSAIVDELAAQDKVFADLQRQLEDAKNQGERLKQTAVIEECEADIPAPCKAPSMAELFALAESKGTAPPKATCQRCEIDSYALESQLVPCSRCGSVWHAGCVGLRPIPFKGATTAEVRNRQLFVRRYFADWLCAPCKNPNPPATTPKRDREREVEDPHLCAHCQTDADRSQLLTCATCARRFHTTCLKLRRIPFSSTHPAEKPQRNRFLRTHFAAWTCPECSARPPAATALAADLADARATIARQATQLDELRRALAAPAFLPEHQEGGLCRVEDDDCPRCQRLRDLLARYP